MKIQDALNILGLEAGATQEDIKAAYKKACREYHPDLNPAGLEMMKAVNAAKDALADYDGYTPKNYTSQTAYGKELYNALKAIIALDLNIEICGSWVWVSGNTRAAKDTLKEAGYKFASKKVMWYYRPEGKPSRGRGNWSIGDIRDKYGSAKVKEEKGVKGLK